MAKVVTIQNQDRIIRQRDYDKLGDDKLLVTWFGRTIQGEGPYAGRPSVFLRLAGCNFGSKTDGWCEFCDTSFQFDQGTAWSYQDLAYTLTTLPGYDKNDVLVITGGEPTLQKNLIGFIHGVEEAFNRVQIETNGTQASFFRELIRIEESDVLPDGYKRPSIVVSPKANTKVGRYAEPSEDVKLLASCFKFVVTADPDDPHHLVPLWAREMAWLNRCPVYVSPMAVYRKPYSGEVASAWDHELIDVEETAKNYAYAAKYALENNLWLSIQQHLFLGVA
jgi:7-carboxy-7-deazaguanine synthase